MKGRNVMNNMNFEEFVLQIQNLLRESDSNLDIQVQTVSKNNGMMPGSKGTLRRFTINRT